MKWQYPVKWHKTRLLGNFTGKRVFKHTVYYIKFATSSVLYYVLGYRWRYYSLQFSTLE